MSNYQIVSQAFYGPSTDTIYCPAGLKVLSGGYTEIGDVIDNGPTSDGTGWTTYGEQARGPNPTIYAICATVS